MASRQDVQKRRAWEVRFGRFRASGLTVARFCEQERVSAHTFYYWAIGYTWSYDAASYIIGMTSPDGVADDFAYDATDQLTGVDYTYQAGEDYTYDDNGNRQTANGSTYATGNNNRLTSDGHFTYTCDAEGTCGRGNENWA